MANPDHVAIVKQGAEAIRIWREQHPEERLDLSGADLRRLRGLSADLHAADLRAADLRRAYLESATLRGADLREAKLRRVDLRKAILERADLCKADLRRADLREAKLWRATLRGADLENANLYTAGLHGADLENANLHAADLREADLRRTDLRGANLREALLAGANMRDVWGAYWAHGLEATRFTPTSGRGSSDAFYFETCIRFWPERWLDWERLRLWGRLPLFGPSYSALILILIIFYGLDLYNDYVKLVRAWAEQVRAQPDLSLHRLAVLVLERLQQRPIPQQSLQLFFSTILLAVGSTLYTLKCPSRIKEFSQDQWCDQLGHSLVHYWPLAWQYRYIRLVCAACYVLGSAGALWVLLTKVCWGLRFILKYSPYPWPWR
jgi:Pentapeptide repeats (8 copies)